MYLGVDIGGTKTLLAVFDHAGTITEEVRFATPKPYEDFIAQFATAFSNLKPTAFQAACVAVPGKLNRHEGIVLALGNLPWQNEPIAKDLEQIIKAPVIIENDANLAGLSEAKLVIDEFKKVLYVTISTGIGTGIITNGVIDPEFIDSEGGHLMLEHQGKIQEWEHFASGKAIERRFGKQAREIHDEHTWKVIAHDIALGFLNLIAVIQPEVIIIGGGVGTHFTRFDDLLLEQLQKYQTPLTPTPVLRRAKRPGQAVLYGCYELIKARSG